MDQTSVRLICAALLCGAAFGQTFEAADVHLSKPGWQPYVQTGYMRGRYEVTNATMVDLICLAFDVKAGSVYGGPVWLARERYDIVAKAPADSTAASRTLMLRALLADRFKLVVHDDAKPLEVFALTQMKPNANLRKAGGEGDAVCKPRPGADRSYIEMNCKNLSMDDLATQFRQYAQVGPRIVDATGLKGTYDFTIKWSVREPGRQSADDSVYISFPEALEKQLGLRLVAEKRPLPVIAVDSVNRMPTENDPDVLSKLPPVPAEFDVAVIRPSKPDQKPGGGIRPGGRIDVQGISLKTLIQLAWDVDPIMIVGAPKWVETEKYDIVASTAAGSAPPPMGALRTMLRALLADRFRLVVHNEDQPVPVWTLTVGKRGLKLKEADPASRSACYSGPGETGTGSATLPATVYTCYNTTMAQLAEGMHRIAGGYVDHPAVDASGLKGAWDLVITWTPKAAIGGLSGDRANGPAQPVATSDPTGGITFFEAVEKLGLHLESGQKRPMPVLVVDRAEKVTAAVN